MKKKQLGTVRKRVSVWFLGILILLLLSLFAVGVGAVYYVETTTEAHLDISQYSFGDSVSGSTLYYYAVTEPQRDPPRPCSLRGLFRSKMKFGFSIYFRAVVWYNWIDKKFCEVMDI